MSFTKQATRGGQLIFDRTRLCESIRSNGSCMRSDHRCRHAHDIDEVRSTLHVFRTRECIKKPCYANFMCRGAHVWGEVQLVKHLIDYALLPTEDGCVKHSDYLRLLRDLGSIGPNSGYKFMELVEELRTYYDIKSAQFDSPAVFQSHIASMKEEEASSNLNREINHRRMLVDVLLATDEEEESAYVMRCQAAYHSMMRTKGSKMDHRIQPNAEYFLKDQQSAAMILQSQPSFPVLPTMNSQNFMFRQQANYSMDALYASSPTINPGLLTMSSEMNLIKKDAHSAPIDEKCN